MNWIKNFVRRAFQAFFASMTTRQITFGMRAKNAAR